MKIDRGHLQHKWPFHEARHYSDNDGAMAIVRQARLAGAVAAPHNA
jgi:hypothetical protein